ncbi:MAG: hypothetical protein J1E39_05450, partial [Eubacterium sp.]|nr:hypothetical protein [Eubacterium sp.]
GTLHDEIIEITLDKFTQKPDGTYELVFTDIAAGEYIVTETNTEIDGYRLVTDASVTGDTAEVTKGETTVINLKDSYEAIGNLKITKSIDGLNVTDEEKAGGLKFTVRNKDGKYLDIDGTLHDEIVEITLDKFTQKDDGTYELVFTDIVVGEYTVTETNTEIDGYKFVSEESTTNGSAEVKSNETVEIALKDSYEKIVSVTINKKDIANDEEIEGAKLEMFDKDNNKIDEWISEKGKTHTIEGLKPGEEYILRETVTPDGYETATEITFTVDENGEVTVVSGKDGSVEDGVLIVNDTKISESEPETPDNNTNVNDSDKDNGEDEPNNDNTDSSDNVDNNPETGYKTDAMSVFLLTASALVVVSAKKRKKANNK